MERSLPSLPWQIDNYIMLFSDLQDEVDLKERRIFCRFLKLTKPNLLLMLLHNIHLG